ncbi:MAG: hypothetical protein ACFCD0_06840 [Gemmataceae bacterium]
MARKSNKPKPEKTRSEKKKVVAFKVEEELANFLDSLPNKSAFIRKAIAAQLKQTCPLCNGAGVVSRGVHDHYAALLPEMRSRDCDSCGDTLTLPKDSGELSAEAHSRLEQFFDGGPFYCNNCYEKAPTCDDCGWHIAEENVADHIRDVHSEA